MDNTTSASIVLFDGLCNLCSSTVQRIIKSDPKKKFKLGALQSKAGESLMVSKNIDHFNLTTFILIENGEVFTKSTAALRIARRLNGFWPLLYGLIIVPRPLRDMVYSWVSKHRYRWFGKKTSCWVPNSDFSDRFID
jgi:predicted DCC family thiol-disulfide oxidoreductase YuxK